jgi:hypothetical protein
VISPRIIVPFKTADAAKATALAASVVDFDCDVRLVEWAPGDTALAWPGFISDSLDHDGIVDEAKGIRRPLLIVAEGYEIDSNQLMALADHPADVLHGDWGFFLKPSDVVRNFIVIWFRWCLNGKITPENELTRKATVEEAFGLVRDDVMKAEVTVMKLAPAEAGLKKGD